MASLLELVRRRPAAPWQEGSGIPWDEPGFSGRMLREHLSQAHDLASRRNEVIDAHVEWIHKHLLGERPSRVLDLGCGPGLYTSRLAELGHECLGIDFSPASIAYATEHLGDQQCSYRCEDIRGADYGSGYDLVMLVFGEFNALKPQDAAIVMRKSRETLSPGGTFLLEAHTAEAVRAAASRPASWFAVDGGLFSDQPHICLQERSWHPEEHAATIGYHIIDATTCNVTSHLETRTSYTDEEYRSLLSDSGFGEVTLLGTLPGTAEAPTGDMVAYVARVVGHE
jgi:SAM-dependent methyltransferase